jgi:hypothetical protein
MPPQKNSGNKKFKRQSGLEMKNRKFIQTMMSDLKADGKLDEDIHIARVMKRLGNGRMEVFYVTSFENEKTGEIELRTHNAQAVIRGSFRGRGKHDVWIDVGSVVVIADTGVGILEITALLTREQAKEFDVDPRIVEDDETREDVGGFEFEGDTKNIVKKTDEVDLSDGDIDNI